MTYSLPYLLLVLALLWYPRSWLKLGAVFGRRRHRKVETEPWKTREVGDPRVRFTVEFAKFRNYVDLLRAGAGSIALFGALEIAPAIAPAAGAPRSVAAQVLGVRAAILLIGLLIQTVRYERKRLTFFPPIFYLGGLSIALCDVRGAAFAFMLIWVINAALPSPMAFLTVYALLLVTFGHFFAWAGDILAVYAGILCFTPVLLSLLGRRPLVVFGRKSPFSG